MAKLYFRYGTMDSAKSMNLLAVAHNYREQGKKVALLKPALDDRFGQAVIRSRAGIEQEVDLLLQPDSKLDPHAFEGVDCVLVDEAQFLSAFVIDQLRGLTKAPGVPVICYGLRTDFRTELFEGARRLFEVADRIEEVKVTCQFCNRKAIFNMRSADGTPTLEGAQVMLGAEESYAPICYACFSERVAFGSLSPAPNAPKTAE
jgi:thymidine kinase